MDHAFTRRLCSREVNFHYPEQFSYQSYIDGDLLQRFRLEHELNGHTGCVNCLDWNQNGRLLASGSDDTNIILWDPFSHKALNTIQTGHHGNIFSVKFMPHTNDKVVATGAADCHVFIHDVNYSEKMNSYTCNSRVKRLVSSPASPDNLWSASEDGMIREFDIRQPARTGARVIIDLTQMCGPDAECKCLAINPIHTHLLAVGANDPYVRLYDRRMIRDAPQSPPQYGQKRKDNFHYSSHACASYFIPGHLRHKQKEYRRKMRYLCSTYVAFSPLGNELLVNIGGEQVYLFDIYNRQKALFQPSITTPNKSKKSSLKNGSIKLPMPSHGDCPHSSKGTNGISSTLPQIDLGDMAQKAAPTLSPEVERLKDKANELFGKQQFSAAIMVYNAAINLASKSSVLYGNRAAAYIKRAWDGDMYAALRDCNNALVYNTEHIKAHFRLVRCLFELHWLKEAQSCLAEFKQKYPSYAKSRACSALEKDIKSALKSPKKSDKDAHEEESFCEEEKLLQVQAYDYLQRYCGHCNTTTDIKEANFLGSAGQYIIAGSDDGSFFVWEKKTANLVRVMHADDSIVNCLQPHPFTCLLATSGIDYLVRLWSPMGGDACDDRTVLETENAAAANQKRMNTDPLETMLLSMGIRTVDSGEEPGDGIPCSTS
uniref:WD and tetratricopeptide repeats protein 1-like n=1 Tax=Phallusia mammillata TaxID=59560 RepID=A0A6F9DX44_9ASCI|nr:WD and tetratricopeptide repeats protein 1-like [Phallusia mammillata]